MTIITTQSRITYAGDNVTMLFPIPFEFFLNSDITAIKTAVGGVQTIQALNVDYTLSGAGVVGGGSASKTTPLLTGEALTLFLNPPITQASHYISNSPFPSGTLENDIDRQAQISQRLQDQISRSIRAPDGDVSPSMLLPTAAQRASSYQAFDVNGNLTTVPTAILPGGSAAGLVTFSPPGTGAVTTTVAARLSQTVDAFDFMTAAQQNNTALQIGSIDITAAVNAAITAAIAQGGGAVRCPAGRYLFSSAISATIPANQSLSLFGDGSDLTNFAFAAGGITLNYSLTSGTQTSSAHVRDISFLSQTTNAQNGLTLSLAGTAPNPANSALSDVTNCVFRGADGYAVTNCWAAGVSVVSVSNIQFDNVMCVGNATNTAGIGVKLVSTATAIGVVYDFYGCVFNNLNQGLQYGNYIQGVSIVNCNFTEGTNGIVCPTGATNTDELLVTGSQFNCIANGILLQAGITDIQVCNNYFLIGANSVGVNMLNASGLYAINANIFQRVGGTTQLGSVGVSVGSASNPGPMLGNTFFGLATGIFLDPTSVGANIQCNNIIGCTLPISKAGTNHVIANNPGYNPVGVVGGLTVGASPATITNGAEPTSYYFNQSATFTANVALGGAQIGTMSTAATVIQVHLGPNEACIVTWTTTAPTYTKSIH